MLATNIGSFAARVKAEVQNQAKYAIVPEATIANPAIFTGFGIGPLLPVNRLTTNL